MINPSNLSSTRIKCLHKTPNHFLGSSGWQERGKSRLSSLTCKGSRDGPARTAEGRDSTKNPLLPCFDLNNFFFSLLPLHPRFAFPLEGSQRLKGCLFKLLFTPQTKTSPTQRSQATLANTGHSIRGCWEKMWLKGRGFCKTPFRSNPAVKYTGSWALTEIQAATKSEFRCTFIYGRAFKEIAVFLLDLSVPRNGN